MEQNEMMTFVTVNEEGDHRTVIWRGSISFNGTQERPLQRISPLQMTVLLAICAILYTNFGLFFLHLISLESWNMVLYFVEEDRVLECWICYDPDRTDVGPMINPCECRGDVSAVHHDCLQRWLMEVCALVNNPFYIMNIRITSISLYQCLF